MWSASRYVMRRAYEGSGREDQTAAPGRYEDVFRGFHLVGGGASHLAHAFEDVVHPVDVRLAEQPTVGVHRDLAAHLDVAAGDEVGGFTRSADAERLELDEHDRCEVLVDHEHVDVVGTEAGRLVQLTTEARALLVPGEVAAVVAEHLVTVAQVALARGRHAHPRSRQVA